MSANSQPYFVPYDSKELLRRPLEPRMAFAIDPPGSTEIDDAIDVTFGQDDAGRHAKITTYIADAALVGTYPAIVEQAAQRGFSTYGNNKQPMLPDYVVEQLSLGSNVDVGVPAIAVRMKAYKHGATLCDIERVRVKVRTMTYSQFGHIALRGNQKARNIITASKLLRKNYSFESPVYMDADPHSVVAQHMLLTNRLVARSMRSFEMPFIYRDHQTIQGKNTSYAMYSDAPLPHESLNVPQYCHFTSPLRRFPDLANHINLAAIIDGRAPVYSRAETKEIASYINNQMSRIPYYENAA